MLKTISSIVLVCSFGTLIAQEQSLEQCIVTALKNNPQTRLAELDQKMPELKVQELQKLLYPRFSLNADYKYYYQMPKQLIPAAAFGGPAGVYNEVTFGVPHNLTTGLQGTQVIYNKPLFYGIEKAKQSQRISQIQLEKVEEDLVVNVSTIYYNAQQLRLQKKFLQENAKNIEQLTQMTKNLKDAQMAKGTDVEQLELNKKMIGNQIAQIQIAYEQLMNTLGLLMNVKTPVEVTEYIDESASPQLNPTQNVSNSVLLLEEQRKLLAMDLKGYRYESYPTLNAYAQYGYNGFGQTGSDAFFKMIPVGVVGLQFNFNIYDWGLYGVKKAQKMVEFEKLDTQTELMNQQQSNELKNAQLKIKSIQSMIALEKDNIALAEKLLEKAKLQLKEGVINITEVLNRENVLLQAQNNYNKHFIDLRLAELEAKKASNSLISKK